MSFTIALLLITSLVLTGLMISYLRKKGIQDVPNERSSHTIPTPRGGGIIIAGLTLLALLLDLLYLPLLSKTWLSPLIVAGAGVAAIGFLDDLKPIAPRPRLIVQIIAAALIVLIARRDLFLLHPAYLAPIGVLYLVTAINFTNFMDGINGIATLQLALTASLSVWLGMHVFDPELQRLGALLAVAALGFLPWNFPRARIFMGDVGSGFVGLMLGVLVLRGFNHPPHVWVPLVASVFFFWLDPLVTLIKRWRRGARISEAHREHLYQHLAQKWGSHAPVALLYVGSEAVLALVFAFALR